MEFMEGVNRKDTLELGELLAGDFTGKEGAGIIGRSRYR